MSDLKTTARRAAPYTGNLTFARLDAAVIAVDFETRQEAKGENKTKEKDARGDSN